jgi:GNAT superfamily N-acetyltransferase
MTVTHAIRAARPGDEAAIHSLVRELAVFEKLEHLMQATPQALAEHLFGTKPIVEAVVAEAGHEVVAFALFFTNYSTFLGKPGLWLEDLYVRPEHRGSGLGKQLITQVAQLAVQRGCGRFEWSVLDWNENAIGFYQGLGATVMPDWRICRLTGEALLRVGRAHGGQR